MHVFVQKHLNTLAFCLSMLVFIIAVIAWGQRINWQLSGLSVYQIFPLFGLLAFSLMWVHFIIAGVKAATNNERVVLNRHYFEITAAVVLAALLLHPSLLILQLWRDGFGLPPGSYNQYVAPGAMWAVYLGMICWLAFMSFELRRWFSDKKWWKYVLYANDIAIWGIFIHSLKLGADVSRVWLHKVWIVYGILLGLAFIAIYYKKWFAFKRS